MGLAELHFHDHEYIENRMAAAQGASIKELTERVGHSSPRAVLIYLHAARERDHQIAADMDELFAGAKKPSGPGRAPTPNDRAPNSLTAVKRESVRNIPLSAATG